MIKQDILIKFEQFNETTLRYRKVIYNHLFDSIEARNNNFINTINESYITGITEYEKNILEQFDITVFKDIQDISVASIYHGVQDISYNDLCILINKVNDIYNIKINEASFKKIKVNFQSPEEFDKLLFYNAIQYYIIGNINQILNEFKIKENDQLNINEFEYNEKYNSLSFLSKLIPNKRRKEIIENYNRILNNLYKEKLEIKSHISKLQENIIYDENIYPLFKIEVNNLLNKINHSNDLINEVKQLIDLDICKVPISIVNKINVLIENEFDILPDNNINNIEKSIFDNILSINLLKENFSSSLRKYQEFAVKMCLYQKRILLGDEMGLGKTVQALSVITHLYNQDKKRSIVILPLTLSYSWMDEVEKHTKLKCYNLRDEGMKAEWFKTGGILIASFESVNKYVSLLKHYEINMIVVDECHYIKSPFTQRTRNCITLLDKSEYTLLMSGTPLENKVKEMINMFTLLKYDVTPLNSNYIKPNEFKKIISDKYIRRKREDVLKELPTKDEIDIKVSLSNQEKELYIKSLTEKKYNDSRRLSFNCGVKSTKLDIIKSICDEAIENNKKVLIFSKYLDTLNLIHSEVKGSIGIIQGNVSAKSRFDLVRKLEYIQEGAVLCSQVIAGGVGLNLQTASIVILCEPQDKPSTEDQVIARVYRMGQINNVIIYRLFVPNSIEEIVRYKLEEKRSLFKQYAEESNMGEYSKILETEVNHSSILEEAIKLLEKDMNFNIKLKTVESIEVPKIENCSVTEFCDLFVQPNGGYLPISDFSKVLNADNEVIDYETNPSIVGLVVDYLSRVEIVDGNINEIFNISHSGAIISNELIKYNSLISTIKKGLSDETIKSAAKLVTLDSVYRAGVLNSYDLELEISKTDISSIRRMIKRVLLFHDKYKIIETGMTFEGSYTNVIVKGDADFLTEEGLWDLKVIKSEPTTKHTLQLLLYYILGVKKYGNIKYIGFFNPKLNIEYIINVYDIDKYIIKNIMLEIEYLN